MNKIIKNIVAIIVMASLTAGFAGIQVYHHVCGSTHVHLVSLFSGKTCSHHKQIQEVREEVVQKTEPVKSCCASSEEAVQQKPEETQQQDNCCDNQENSNVEKPNDGSPDIAKKECCINFSEYVALDNTFIIQTTFSNDFFQHIYNIVADNQIFRNLSDNTRFLSEKIPKTIRLPDRIVTYIHLITSRYINNNTDDTDLIF